MSQTYQQVPKEQQNYKCFKCQESIYFKHGFKTEDNKPQRFNVKNDQVHVCNQTNSTQQKTSGFSSDKARKAYFAKKRSAERGQTGEHQFSEAQQRENDEFNRAQDQARQEAREQRARETQEAHRRSYRRRSSRRSYSSGFAEEAWNRYEQRQRARQESQKYQSSIGMTFAKAIDILHLEAQFTKDQLETAKKTLWLKFHPDRNHGVGASELFRDVTDAYEFLVRQV